MTLFDRRSLRSAWIPSAVASALMFLLSLGDDRSTVAANLGQSIFVGSVVGLASYFAAREERSQKP